MNIFYDDLYEKYLEDDIRYFKKHGMIIPEGRSTGKPDISALESNLYQYLEDYRNMGFKFIELPEQAVEMILDGEIFRCFGKCSEGFFVLNEEQEVYLLLNEYCSQDHLSSWFYSSAESVNQAVNRYECFIPKGFGFLFVNKSLRDFVKCYSYLMMRIFSLKAEYERITEILENEAAILESEIRHLSSIAMEEGTYWNQMIFQIIDNLGWFHLTPEVVPYLKY